jgi:hypothetical protein
MFYSKDLLSKSTIHSFSTKVSSSSSLLPLAECSCALTYMLLLTVSNKFCKNQMIFGSYLLMRRDMAKSLRHGLYYISI